VGVPIELDQLQREVPDLGGGGEDLDGLGGHVLADAVARQHGNALSALAHGRDASTQPAAAREGSPPPPRAGTLPGAAPERPPAPPPERGRSAPSGSGGRGRARRRTAPPGR